MNARDYWKQVVIDCADCVSDIIELSEEQIEKVVEYLMNNDHFWTDIEYYVNEAINWVRRLK